jgi:adenylate cyclase
MRVARTFAFLDLCGFTAYTEEHGDSAAVAVLAQLRSALRAEAELRGVRVTKWLGDGAMLSGVEPLEVVACVVSVRDTIVAEGNPLALRAGVCEGMVIMFEGDDYIGGPVNTAARLCDAAAPGQVLVEASCPVPEDRDRPAIPRPGVLLPSIARVVETVEVAPLPPPAAPPAPEDGGEPVPVRTRRPA